MVNTMLHKTIQIQWTNPYLFITDNEQYCACPIDLDIVKCLISRGHFCSLLGDIYTIEGNYDCETALYFTEILKCVAQIPLIISP